MTPHLLQVFDALSKNDKFTHGLLVIGIVMITTSLLVRYRKRSKQSRIATVTTPQEHTERARQHRGMRGDLENLMVEIEQLARRFSAQLDAKSIQLEQMIDKADRCIARLEQLNQYGPPDSRLAADNGQGTAHATTPSITPANDALARSIYNLADQGLGPGEIAQKLGELVGKIELILALRNA